MFRQSQPAPTPSLTPENVLAQSTEKIQPNHELLLLHVWHCAVWLLFIRVCRIGFKRSWL